MPIQLDQISTTSTTTNIVASPKFFHQKLTGKGGTQGLLGELSNPRFVSAKDNFYADVVEERKHFINGNTEVWMLPIDPLQEGVRRYATDYGFAIVPDIHQMTLVYEEDLSQRFNEPHFLRIFVQLAPISLTIQETRNPDQTLGRKFTPMYEYRVFFIHSTDPQQDPTKMRVVAQTHTDMANAIQRIQKADPQTNLHPYSRSYTIRHVTNPRVVASEVEELCINNGGYQIDMDALNAYIEDYSLYDNVIACADVWMNSMEQAVTHVCEVMALDADAQLNMDGTIDPNSANHLNHHSLHMMSEYLRYLETYSVPLDTYRAIYRMMTTLFQPEDVTYMCKQNLNLLLSDTLHSLDTSKDQLTQLTVPNPAPAIDPKYSIEQRNAITTTEPLTLVQAGAGSGKSSVILARIKYMIECGIDPADITVLSFTNAAADHIKDLNPNINSMTIASMIHSIYTLNHPKHQLSSVDTIINSLGIYYPSDQIAMEFTACLWNVLKNNNNAFTEMNNFIEAHYDEVIAMLDTIEQTALELEIIICYQKIDFFQEPADVTSKYLIIDEVQDNSIFEFIYVLRYVDKHKESLFFVGDGSQTLYEFRASNPKALNVLEGSGVFATYKLQTNYRSNQEILDMANQLLANIEANQYAKIQLQANALTPVTEHSFTEKVTLNYETVRNQNETGEALRVLLRSKIKKYVQEKLKNNEQVAFLAFDRRTVFLMQEELQKLFPAAKIANIVPTRTYNSTLFTEFIKRYWSVIQFVPKQNTTFTVAKCIEKYIGAILRTNNPAAEKRAYGQIQDWLQTVRTASAGWQQEHDAGAMTTEELLNNIKDSLIRYEIKNNAIRNAVLSSARAAQKDDDHWKSADIVLSTIHSAKGLEFENVVVVYKDDNQMAEDKKRMYYVALTRAMKSEFIAAFGSLKNPPIITSYAQIVRALKAKAANAAQSASAPAPTTAPD